MERTNLKACRTSYATEEDLCGWFFFFVMKIGSLFNAEYSFQHRLLMPKTLIYRILH